MVTSCQCTTLELCWTALNLTPGNIISDSCTNFSVKFIRLSCFFFAVWTATNLSNSRLELAKSLKDGTRWYLFENVTQYFKINMFFFIRACWTCALVKNVNWLSPQSWAMEIRELETSSLAVWLIKATATKWVIHVYKSFRCHTAFRCRVDGHQPGPTSPECFQTDWQRFRQPVVERRGKHLDSLCAHLLISYNWCCLFSILDLIIYTFSWLECASFIHMLIWV